MNKNIEGVKLELDVETLKVEINQLLTETFEIEDISDLENEMAFCSTSSCSGTSGCCSCSTSTSGF